MKKLPSIIIALATVVISAKVVMVLAEAPNEATAALQEQIDDAKTNLDIVVVPGGDTAINDGITIPYQSGFVMEGIGASELSTSYAAALTGASSRLTASGADRVPMTLLTVNSAETAIRDLSINGYTETQRAAAAAKAACGILLTKPSTGLATGGLLLENAYVIGFETGIQAAVGVTENNCERSTFNKVRFHYDQAGFVCKSQQSMGFGFNDCEWFQNEDCIRVEGGGKIVVNNAFVHFLDDSEEHTFLRFAPRVYNTSIGPNSGHFVINGLYADAIAPDLKLVVMAQKDESDVVVPYYTHTTFAGFHLSLATYTEPSIEVAGWSTTTFRDGWGLHVDCATWNNEPSGASKTISRLVFDNVMIWDAVDGEDVVHEESARGESYVIVSRCYNQFGAPITDFDGLVVGDVP